MSEHDSVVTTSSSGMASVESLPVLKVTPDTAGCLHLFSPAKWDGQHVWVHKATRNPDDPMFLAVDRSDGAVICPPFDHDLEPWIRSDGYPTGFLTCRKCLGTAHEPRPETTIAVQVRI